MAVNRLNSGKEGAFTSDIRRIINSNFSDVSLCDTQLDITSSTTLTNISSMTTGTLQGGGTYKFRALIPTVCTANNGSKFAFKQSVASMITAIEYEARMYTATGVAVSRGTTITDQALLADNTAAVVIFVEITGVVDIALDGTLQLQAAQHTSSVDVLSIFKKAQMQFERITTG